MHCYINDNFIAEFGEAYVTITLCTWNDVCGYTEIKEMRSLLHTSFLWLSHLKISAIIIEWNIYLLNCGNNGNILSSVRGITLRGFN